MATKKPVPQYRTQTPALDLDAGMAYLQSGGAATMEPAPEPAGAMRRYVGDTAVSLVKSAMGVPETMVGMANMLTGGRAGKAVQDAGVDFKAANAVADTLYSPEYQAASKAVQGADGIVDTLRAAFENPSTIYHGAVTSAGSMLTGAPIGKAAMLAGTTMAGRAAIAAAPAAERGAMLAATSKTPGWLAGGLSEGVSSAGQNMEQVRQESKNGLLSGDQVGIIGGSGAITALITAVSGRLANRLGIGDINQMIAGAQRAGPAVQKGLARTLAEGFATEGLLQEFPQSWQEQVAQNIATGKPWDQGAANAAVMGGLSGGLLGTAAAPFGRGGDAAPVVDPGQQAADDLRATKQPEGGPMTRAANAAIEAQAQAADAGMPNLPTMTAEQEAAALTAIEAQGGKDAKGLRQFAATANRAAGTRPAGGTPAGQMAPGQDPAEPSATVSDMPFGDRVLTLREQLGDRATREALREQFGDDALSQAAYYASIADRPDVQLPNRTRDNMLALAERMVSMALLKPIDRPGLGGAGPAPDQLGGPTGNAPPQIELDTTPTGTIRVDGEGNAAPETRADAIDTRNATPAATGDDRQARKASAVNADPAPAADPKPAGQPALGYDTTPTGRMRAGSEGVAPETAADAINTRQAQGERDAEAQRKADLGLTPDVQSVQDRNAQGRAMPGDLLNPKGEPFKHERAAITAQKKAKGGTVLQVAGGWVVRPEATTTEATNAQAPVVPQAAAPAADPQAAGGTGSAEAAQAAAGATGAGATAAPAVEAPGLKPADLVKVKTRFGANTYVRRADMEGDEGGLIRMFTADGKNNGRIARGNLDPTGEKRTADAKDNAENPLFDVIGAKGGKVFASKAPATRELNRLGMGETHEVVPAGKGFAIRKKAERAAPAADLGPETFAGSIKEEIDRRAKAAEAKAARAKPDAMPKPAAPEKEDAPYSAKPDGQGGIILQNEAEEVIGAPGGGGPRKFKNEADALTWAAKNDVPVVAEQPPPAPPTKPKTEASKNTVFTEDMAAAARARLKAKLGRLNSGLDPETMMDGITLAGYHIEKGARRFAAFARAMVDDLGDGVKPYLKSFYNALRDFPGFDANGMTDYDSVSRADIDMVLREAADSGVTAEAISATHKDPGEPAELVTPAVVRDAIKTGVAATDRKPSAMRAELLQKVDDAIAKATDEAPPVWKEPTKDRVRQAMIDLKLTSLDRAAQALRNAHDNRVAEAARRIGYVNFDVEGDGKFTVLNSRAYLEDFRRKVETSPGFKDRQTAPGTGRDGGENGSGGKQAAFANMVDEGDLDAALDYAEAVGIDPNFMDPSLPVNTGANARMVVIDKAADGAEGNGVAFSRSEGKQEPSGDRRQAVESLVAQVAARWANAPEVVVIDGLADPRVPEAVRSEDQRQQSQGAAGQPEGFFYGGKVYLIAPQLGGDADVVRVLFHESLGHYGLRGTFGAALGGILDRVAILQAAKVRAKAKQYGLDYDKPSDRRAAAEEVLADMAQTTPNLGWGAKAIAAVRTWLRQHVPGFSKMALSDAELVRSFILPARAFVQRGEGGKPAGGAMFSRTADQTKTEAFRRWFGDSKVVDEAGAPLVVYHGTARNFSTFQSHERYPSKKLYVDGKFMPKADGWDMGDDRKGIPEGIHYGAWTDALTMGVDEAIKFREAEAERYGEQSEDTQRSLSDLRRLAGKKLEWRDEAHATGDGFYFSPAPSYSNSFSGRGAVEGGLMMPVYLSIKNPVYLDSGAIEVAGLANNVEKYKAQGYDGAIFVENNMFGSGRLPLEQDRGTYSAQIVAFYPEQIKSAIGNAGTFDPQSPDIRFSRAAAADAEPPSSLRERRAAAQAAGRGRQRLSAQDLINSSGGLFNLGETKQDRTRAVVEGSRPFWLAALTRDQIADMYGDEIPPVREYDNLTRQMENERQNAAQKAEALYEEWSKLDAASNDVLARVMLDATVAQVHPDRPAPDDLTLDQQKEHDRLSAEFSGLAPEAQAMYAKVRDFHAQTLADLRKALEGRIERLIENGSERAVALADIRKRFDQYMKGGPYFPLHRFGDFLVIAEKPDGERVVAAYENAGEQAAAARALESDGFTVKLKMAKAYNRAMDGSAGKFIGDVLQAIDKMDMKEARIGSSATTMKTQLLDDLNQLFIKALPDLSYRKHFTHRKGTAGFSSDVMRGFASSAFHAAGHIARMNHGDKMTFALEDAYTAIESAPEGDFTKATQILGELAKRHEAALNPNTNPLSALATQVGFVMYLGLSPAAGLINLLQVPMVALPYIGARYGFGRTAVAMGRAYRDIMGAKPNSKSGFNAAQSPRLTAEERRAISMLQEEGVIDLTQAHDLASATERDVGNQARSKASFAIARAMRIVGWTFHVPEVMNRQVTALLAYRLEMAKSSDEGKAMDAAREAIKRTQFDYSASNRSRLMSGNIARVVTQFKQFSQNMTYFLGRAAYQAMKDESPEVRRIARNQLLSTFLVTGAMAGSLGLPGIGFVATLVESLVNAMGGDDDEPWDWKTEYRNMLADTFGKEWGEVMAKGVPRALMPAWDISGRVGLADLWWRDASRESDSPREAFASDMGNVLGPTAGTALGWYTAADHMGRGDYAKAVESIVPKFIRDPLKAYRESQDGITAFNGEPLMELTPVEVLGRFNGFAPARASEMFEGRNAVKNAEAALVDRRTRLITQAAKARMDGDQDAVKELQGRIGAWNQANPAMRITIPQIMQSIRTRQRNRNNTEQGVTLSASREFLRDRARFADVE